MKRNYVNQVTEYREAMHSNEEPRCFNIITYFKQEIEKKNK